ncbi:ATP-binding protein [Azospirillum argentinense]|uniref:hybrid sensor histidine kinase/response regulator n=1 Tax=Azospirillum argentinense TaxID=2970906 RepID=UPI00190EB95C|nr:ATP-binding protein [Azospirillum argentinense]
MKRRAEWLTDALRAECGALVDEGIRLAKQKGYADQTSSMRAAWTEATVALNEGLAAYLSDPLRRDGHSGHNNYRTDPRFDRLRHIAQTHHDAGIPLELNNGLLKLYRRAYRNRLGDLPDGAREFGSGDAFRARLDDFFDEVELAMLVPWAVAAPQEEALSDSLRRLTRERDQYFAALESLRNPVFILDEDGRLLTANRAALQFFLDMPEAGALTYRLALQPHRSELQAVVDQIVATPGTEWNSIWMQTRQGSRCFDIRLRSVEDTVHKLRPWQIMLLHDVTEHHQAIRRAREAERTMSLFLAAMSHEIRAPLHSVLGAASLMKGASPEKQEELVELLDIAARSLNTTLENVLSFSRFEHQAPQPRPVAVCLREALGDLVRIKDIPARQLGVPLRLEMAPGLSEHVRLDWSMIQQILGNLIQNALRHDDGRGVLVGLRVEDGMLVFRVADHGPGMPEEIRDMLAQAPVGLRPRTTGRNGSGLGLAIAQRMTLALGGGIAVLDPREGAVVEVRLPLVVASPAEPPARQSMPDDRLHQNCLMVDDDPINAQVTAAMLDRMGLSVDHAQTLEQAHALLLAAPDAYGVFLLDYRLPDGTGPGFAREIRRNPALADASIILLSANADWVRASPADAGLFQAILEKPLDATALGKAIRGKAARPAVGAGGLLDGLSPTARRRMAEAFTRGWTEFRTMLEVADPAERDAALAALAHKLASGAATFGLDEIADRLRRIEAAHEDGSVGAATRAKEHGSLLACSLPPDWRNRFAEDFSA